MTCRAHGALGRGLHPVLAAQVDEREVVLARELVLDRQRHPHRVVDQRRRLERRGSAAPRRGTRTAARGRTRRRAAAARSPRAHPRRARARRPGAGAGRQPPPAGSASTPADGNEAMRRRPPRTPSTAARSSSAAWTWAKIASACWSSVAPAAVGAHAAAVADEQRRAGLGLEPRDRLGDGRLRVVERIGRRRERSALDDLARMLSRVRFSISRSYASMTKFTSTDACSVRRVRAQRDRT